MGKQLIIALGREFGSGGHVVARMIAEHYQIPIYDSNILKDVADEKNIEADELKKYDENPKNPLLSRTVHGFSNSPEENIARMQFEYIKNKADKGESFVIVGRCGESILKDNPNMISVFILGDTEQKILRTMERNGITRDKAKKMNEQNDRRRKIYHNHYCDGKWGDSRNYEISVNSSKIGIEETAKVVIDYIEKRIKSK